MQNDVFFSSRQSVPVQLTLLYRSANFAVSTELVNNRWSNQFPLKEKKLKSGRKTINNLIPLCKHKFLNVSCINSATLPTRPWWRRPRRPIHLIVEGQQ